jgi:hypothetical protein
LRESIAAAKNINEYLKRSKHIHDGKANDTPKEQKAMAAANFALQADLANKINKVSAFPQLT